MDKKRIGRHGDGRLYSLALFIIISAVLGLFLLASKNPTGYASDPYSSGYQQAQPQQTQKTQSEQNMQDMQIVQSVQPQDTCTESDGGKNFYSSGNLALNGVASSSDFCVNDKTVQEYYCDANRNSVSEQYTCPEKCYNGACIAGERKKESTLLLVNADVIPIQKISESPSSGESSGGETAVASGIKKTGELTERFVCGDYSKIKPLSASASSFKDEFYAANAIDGNTETSWYGKTDDLSKTITFDFGENRCLRSYDLYFFYWDVPVNVDIDVSSDGVSWKKVVSSRSFNLVSNVNIKMPEIIIARYVKLKENHGIRDYGNLDEISFEAAQFKIVRE